MKKRKRQKEIPGGIVKIPFDDGWHTYGRILNYGDLAIYDLKTQEDITDLDYIISRPILFKCIVNDNGVKGGKYPIIGIIALETSLENSKYYFGPTPGNEDYGIYENGNLRKAISKEECIGLPVGAVWDPDHISERLKDHYSGVEDKFMKYLDPLGNYKLI